MKMQAKILVMCGLTAAAGLGNAQYLAESEAAMNMNNSIQGQMPGAPPPMPGQLPGVPAPGAGFTPGAMGGNTMPGMDPMMMGDPAMAGYAGQATQAMVTPAPIETVDVLTGRRVYDAVSGGLLEDAVEIAVRPTDVTGEESRFLDDGLHDNGIAGDDIRGDVQTFTGQYIGQFSNLMKNYLIHAVRNAENIDPMVYYGYYVSKIDPPLEGMKRYGLPLPGEQDELRVKEPLPDMPNVLDLENDRDELVRQWNHEFLAEYRVTPEDPQSEYFPVFIPSPPLTPTNYPVPNGYVSPQSLGIANESASAAAAAVAVDAATQGVNNTVANDLMGGGV